MCVHSKCTSNVTIIIQSIKSVCVCNVGGYIILPLVMHDGYIFASPVYACVWIVNVQVI